MGVERMDIKVAVYVSLLISSKMMGLTMPGNGFCHRAWLVERINLYTGGCFMIHAVQGFCKCEPLCFTQPLVPVWEWKCYKPSSCLIMISINLDFPADCPPFNSKCNFPKPLSWNIQYILNTHITF